MVALSLGLFMAGYVHPDAILLDVPFALAYFLIDLAGLWETSPLWVKEHPILCLLCDTVWPLLVSVSYSYGIVHIARRIGSKDTESSRMYARIFMVSAVVLILAVVAKPGAAPISFHNYWTTNY